MELHNIENLLQKYLDAQTSIEEEKELKTFFTSNTVPEHLKKYQMLFGYFNSSLQENSKQAWKPKKTNRRYQWMKIAATLLLPVSMYIGYQKYQEYQAHRVYEKTKTALLLLSTNLNKGNIAIAKLQQFENTKQRVFKVER